MFFYNDTATTEIYTLSLHDALPIFADQHSDAVLAHLARSVAEDLMVVLEFDAEHGVGQQLHHLPPHLQKFFLGHQSSRSEEHTSELQSRQYLVCRLLLEKKNHLYLH